MSEERGSPQIIDVQRLVAELKERVARARAAGGYSDDLSGLELEVLPPLAPTDGLAAGFDLAGGSARVRFRPELGFSSKRFIGLPITLVKKFFLRLIFFVLDDLARQTDAAVKRLESALAAEVAARESAARHAGESVKAEVAAREAIARDMHALSERADHIEDALEKLQRDRP